MKRIEDFEDKSEVYAQVLFQADKRGIHYRKKLTDCPRQLLAELIVVIEIVLDELRDKYKATRTEFKK